MCTVRDLGWAFLWKACNSLSFAYLIRQRRPQERDNGGHAGVRVQKRLSKFYSCVLLDAKGDEKLETKGTAEDTLEFELKVRCRRNPQAPKDASDPDELYLDHKGEVIHTVLLPLDLENLEKCPHTWKTWINPGIL